MIFDVNDLPFFEESPINVLDVNQWVERNLPPFEEMERVASNMLAMHGDGDNDWDSLHSFVLFELDRDSQKVDFSVMMAIDPAIPPPSYPSILQEQTGRIIASRLQNEETRRGNPIVACGLMMEAWTLGRKPTEKEQALIENRQLHTIPDAVEQCVVTVVDVAGRIWMMTKTRGTTDTKEFSTTDLNPEAEVHGAFPKALIRLMGATSAMQTLAEVMLG